MDYSLFVGLVTLDVAHLVENPPASDQKIFSQQHFLAAGGPATNAAVTYAALTQRGSGAELPTAVSPTAVSPTAVLLCARGRGPAAQLIQSDLDRNRVEILDATDVAADVAAELSPAISGITVSTVGSSRSVVTSSVRLPVSRTQVTAGLEDLISQRGLPRVVMVDGHYPELAELALAQVSSQFSSQFSSAGTPSETVSCRVLDGGSWKPELPNFLPQIDIAIVSADFMPPGCRTPDDLVKFLGDFGVTKVVRTQGGKATQWWWPDGSGEVTPAAVDSICTLGAGDVFHGAFCCGIKELGIPQTGAEVVEVIEFANRIAGLSTRYFGTRKWLEELA